MQEEKKYLEYVSNIIDNQIDFYTDAIANLKEEEKIPKEQMTLNFYDMDDEELSRQKVELDKIERIEDVLIQNKQRLELQSNKPYFARIDFKEDGKNSAEKIYIGIGAVKDGGDILVCDWRAPVSSMYYEFETGKANYECEDGTINGNIELKRQYVLENKKLKFYIDTNETINDELLQEVLSKNTSSKMREIVSTIQKEQNKLIRFDENKNLLVQGVAGSGKTSIALHKAAYLLYKNKDKMKNSDIFILSPTHLFANYISDVLPQLGEKAVAGTTFFTIAKSELNRKLQTRDIFVDELNETKTSKKLNEISYKASFEFVDDLLNFLNEKIVPSFKPQDLVFKTKNSNKVIFNFPKEEMEKLYFETYKDLPVSKRISYMTDFLIERFNLKSNEFLPIKERFQNFLYAFFPTTDILEILNLFYYSKGMEEDLNKTISYDNIAPLLVVKDFMFGTTLNFKSKYLIVDEMQDFTPAHFYIFNKIWDCPKILLGDINQCIEKKLNEGYLNKLATYFDADLLKLNKTYRSTKQISTLCNKIIGLKDIVHMNRDGQEPEIIQTKNQIEDIVKLLEENEKDFKHIAIIAKTSKEAHNLYEKLEKKLNLQIITDIDTKITKKVIITTPTTSKGVEFDYVLVPNCDTQNYHDELDRNLLYISTTRALHKLTLLSEKDITNLLK